MSEEEEEEWRTQLLADTGGQAMEVQRVYLSMDCQHRRYWAGTLPDVHKDTSSALSKHPAAHSHIAQCKVTMHQWVV